MFFTGDNPHPTFECSDSESDDFIPIGDRITARSRHPMKTRNRLIVPVLPEDEESLPDLIVESVIRPSSQGSTTTKVICPSESKIAEQTTFVKKAELLNEKGNSLQTETHEPCSDYSSKLQSNFQRKNLDYSGFVALENEEFGKVTKTYSRTKKLFDKQASWGSVNFEQDENIGKQNQEDNEVIEEKFCEAPLTSSRLYRVAAINCSQESADGIKMAQHDASENFTSTQAERTSCSQKLRQNSQNSDMFSFSSQDFGLGASPMRAFPAVYDSFHKPETFSQTKENSCNFDLQTGSDTVQEISSTSAAESGSDFTVLEKITSDDVDLLPDAVIGGRLEDKNECHTNSSRMTLLEKCTNKGKFKNPVSIY